LQHILVFNRLFLKPFPFVVGSFLSQPFPFCSTCRTEPAPGQKFPATSTAVNVFLRYRLAYPHRPSEFQYFEQIEAVLWVLVSPPVLFAYLPAYPFSKWPPAQ
jgi:hypothetical protein